MTIMVSNGLRTLGACSIAAGIVLAAPCAQATYYWNMTGTDGSSPLVGVPPGTGGQSNFTNVINGATFTTGTTSDVVGTGVL
jgi:hypothetical protein